MTPKVLIITGMHRSGTSLVTQWLYHCGLQIGDQLFPADVGNVEGHFEDTDFLEIHQQFLKARHDPYTGFAERPVAPLDHNEKKQLARLIAAKNETHNEWGWKEPRTCLFLAAYNELIPSAFYLVIVRDFHSTINSMLAREYKVHLKKFKTKRGLSRLKWILFKKKPVEKIYALHAEHFLRVWINYYEQILALVRTLPSERHLFVNYTSLAKNDTDVFNRLKNDWGFTFDYIPFDEVYKKELLSQLQDIEQHIADKKLIQKAKQIEKECSVYLEISSSQL